MGDLPAGAGAGTGAGTGAGAGAGAGAGVFLVVMVLLRPRDCTWGVVAAGMAGVWEGPRD